MAREAAWRIFAGELNSSSLEKKGDDEKSPSYLITPLGAMVNRVMITGVLTEKENRGSPEEPMWNARIEDVSGSYFLNVGRYQPEAAAAMADLEVPAFVAVVGKVRTYSPDETRTFVSLRPERIIEIEEPTRNLWVLEAARSTWNRLIRMREAIGIPDAGVNELVAKGYSAQEAEGILNALDHYGVPPSEKYLKLIQSALKLLLPDDNIDLGLPGDDSDLPDEIDIPAQASSGSGDGSADNEDIILGILRELDDGPRGAPRDEVDRRAEMEGISANDVEEICNALMDKGLVYEPNLGYLKLIDE